MGNNIKQQRKNITAWGEIPRMPRKTGLGRPPKDFGKLWGTEKARQDPHRAHVNLLLLARCGMGTATPLPRSLSWGLGGEAVKRQMPGSDGVLMEVMLSALSVVPVVIWSEELSEMKHSVISNLACCSCSSSLACS